MFENRVGPHGLKALLLTGLLIIGSAGLSLVCVLVWTLRRAAQQSVEVSTPVIYWVPGKRLYNDVAHQDFIARLQRVAALWHRAPAAIYLLGGTTGTNTVSEAEVGRRLLLQQGVDEQAILLEQRSLHTLENLRFARTMLEGECALAVISNRYHLPRLSLMAASLGLSVQCVAAEDALPVGPASWQRWLLEAFYNHWFMLARWCS
jgi:uncharacterized SAM-binding protein YcdF (DUF218 family)